jgi:hypothetical protein
MNNIRYIGTERKSPLSKPVPPIEWFGQATVAFEQSFPGNPYDHETNDVYVIFSGPSRVKEKRLAYYDNGQWKATLVARRPGTYRAALWRNGKLVNVPTQTVRIETLVPDGFVRRGGHWGFQYDSGKPYWPLGHNLGWQSAAPMPDMTECLALMGKKGINWSRVWACHWDGKNPFWPPDPSRLPLGEMFSDALHRWDEIAVAAQKAGVRFQFVLFHHGGWSTRTNPNWQDNPWNAERGGFLARAADFFTDERARTRSRSWLRYAVARYGHETCIMAWELFNEVEWVDAIVDNRQADVARWHAEMAAYLRSIDPYNHLITTSSHLHLPIWKEMDYYQPHSYPPSMASMVLSTKLPKDKPLFYGEVGPGALGSAKPVQVRAVRDGIWSALLSHHAGAAQYWTWEFVFRYDLLREYELASRLIQESGILSEKELKAFTPQLDAGVGADLTLSPAGGWEPTRKFEYQLPADAVASMSDLSIYLQGQAHRAMTKEPVRFLFHAPSAGVFTIEIVGVSASGGSLKVRVNERVAVERSWAGGRGGASGTRFATPEVIAIPFEAGQATIELSNEGTDWVQLRSLHVSGIGERASGSAIGNRRRLIARIQRAADVQGPVRFAFGGSRLADGSYRAALTDLDTGQTHSQTVQVRRGAIKERLSLEWSDAILILYKGK